MKTKKLLWLFVSLFLLAVPAVQTFASGDEVEIEFAVFDVHISNPFVEGVHEHIRMICEKIYAVFIKFS